MKRNGIDWPEVAARLVRLRLALDVSQVDIDAATGIGTSRWNRFEQGERNIKPDDISALFHAYGVDANFILFGWEDGLPSRVLESMRRLRAK